MRQDDSPLPQTLRKKYLQKQHTLFIYNMLLVTTRPIESLDNHEKKKTHHINFSF